MSRKATTIIISLTIGAAVVAANLFAAVPAKSDTPAQTHTTRIAPESAPIQAGSIRFVVDSVGNVARYRVREQLAGLDLPNDAVGSTSAVTGAITVDQAGKVIPGESRIEVGLAGLVSDKDRRDRYVRSRTLQTTEFPTATLAVTRIDGLTPATKPGGKQFRVDGDLTIRGVTRPISWAVDATISDSLVIGLATTSFTFADFAIAQPRVPVVLSVADTIRLEYEFRLRRASGQT